MQKLKHLFILFALLFSLNGISQEIAFLQQTLNYDFSGGDTELTTDNFLGFSRLSFQLVTTSLDGSNARIQIQKTNNDNEYLDVSGADLIFSSGTNTNFIDIENAKNARYKIILTANTVSSGTIKIDIAATR